MGIVDEDIERVRAASNLVDIVGEHLPLKRVGSRHVGLCPFHAEKSGSFSVNGELGLYYCFGCQAKGDVITFVREINHLDFVGAVESLAGRAGIQLRYDTGSESEGRKRRKGLVEAMSQAVAWYHDRLLNAPDAARARVYLRSRGYDGEVVRHFSIGWAPDGWDTMCKELGLSVPVARDAGLGFVNRRDRLQDSFRNRVLFPIFDSRGEPVAFGGRVLPGDEGPKYKNSPATAIYDKSEVLYGLNWAKSEVVTAGEVVVCEGYTDVIGMTAAGVNRAVATCGTALTDRHFAILKNFARRIVLAYDADAAGQGAAERFYEWERRYDVDVYVAALPPGTDPGDLARHDPEALHAAVTKARRFLEFRIDRLLARCDLDSVEGRARAAGLAGDMIGEHPNQIVRESYAGSVAARLDLPAEAVTARPGRPGRPRDSETGERKVPAPRAASPALLALALAVQRPTEVADLLAEVLFEDEVHLAAYRSLAGTENFQEALGEADPEATELLTRLAVEEVDDVEADDVVARLATEVASRLARGIEASGTEDALVPARWLRQKIDELRSPDGRTPDRRREVLAELVAFVAGQGVGEGE